MKELYWWRIFTRFNRFMKTWQFRYQIDKKWFGRYAIIMSLRFTVMDFMRMGLLEMMDKINKHCVTIKPIRKLKAVWSEEKEFDISKALNGQVKKFQCEVRKEMLEWWNSLSTEAQDSIRKSFKKEEK